MVTMMRAGWWGNMMRGYDGMTMYHKIWGYDRRAKIGDRIKDMMEGL